MCNREVERRCSREIPGRSRVRAGDEAAVTRQKVARSFAIFFRDISSYTEELRYSFAANCCRRSCADEDAGGILSPQETE